MSLRAQLLIMAVISQEDYYMGLENKQRGTYLTIMGGKFCQRVEAGKEGAVERINKVGKVVHEVFYDQFTGTLVNISVQEDTGYGKSWNFHFQDGNDSYFVQMPYSSSNATNFLKIIKNIDLSKPFTISPTQKEVDGKSQTSLFINQGGVPLKHAYTKDVPNGLPDMEQITVKGQQVWDDSKRIAFLHDMVMTDIMPKLKGAGYVQEEGFGVLDEPVSGLTELNDEGDQPF